MEPFTALVGLLPLAESAVKITSRLCKTISEVKGLPGNLRQELDWLIHLRKILVRFEGTCRQLDYMETGVEIDLLRDCLESCGELVQDLEKEIDERLGKIKGKSFRSRIEALSAVFNSEDLQRSKSEIDQCMKDLDLAHKEVSSQISTQHYQTSLHNSDRLASIEQLLKNHIGANARNLDNTGGVLDKVGEHRERTATPQREIFITARMWHGRLDTLNELVDASSRLQCSYEGIFHSLLKHPYNLEEALAVYQMSSGNTTAPTVRQYIGLDTLLKSFRRGLYTHTGPLDVKRWTSQLVNVALRYKLKLGTDLNSGVLYFDGPFKYSIWFDECWSDSLRNRWYDELTSSTKFTYFKDWFDELIRYGARQELDETPHPGSRVEKYLEPTLQALLRGHLSPWLSALMDADIDVFEVARQTYALATGQEAAFIVEEVQIKVSSMMKPFPRKYLLPSYCPQIQTTDDLKEVVLAVFRENGIDVAVKDETQNIDVTSLSLLKLILLALATLTRNWNVDYIWLEDRRYATEI